MPSRTPGPRKAVTLLAVAVATVLLDPPVSTQGRPAVRRFTAVNGHSAVEGEVLIKYRDPRATANQAFTEAQLEADAVERLDRRGLKRLHSRRLRTTELIERLRSDPDVEYVEPNYVLYATALPNDPSFGSLWGLLNTGFNPVGGGGVPGADIDVQSAWNTATGSRTNVVGVVDSGIDYTHPDLAANVWSAPSQFQVTIGGQTITCQAGTHGFNAITRACNPMDDRYHGTHVAGTIGAVGNNGTGVVGVNWTASMMGLKFLNSAGAGVTSDAIAAIQFAILAKAAFSSSAAANIRVLSNSWGGGGYSASLLDAINAAQASDMLFVASAGNDHANNDSVPIYPASFAATNIVAVASTDSADQLSSFSNYGASSVHLAAPGTAIVSTMPSNAYAILQGTSMAAPHVSGAAMLALSMCSVNTAQLKTMLLGSVDVLFALASVTSTGGRLNVARALEACPYPKITSLALSPSVPSPQALGTSVTWTATPTGGQAPYQYQWLIFDGATWSAPTAWASGNTLSWTPSVVGSAYQVAARARSAWNSGARDIAVSQSFAIMPKITSLTLTPSVASPQGVGTSVTWTASASGGQTPYQYQWLVFDGSTWSTPTTWASGNTFSWTPSVAGSGYQVAVRARSAWNTGARDMAVSQAFVIMPKITSLTLTPNVASPQGLGTSVTWTASASGGQTPYQYQWLVFDGSTWSTPTAWASGNTFSWTPSLVGSGYQVAVRARSAWNTGARDMAVSQSFAIMPRITSLTLTPSVTSPQVAGTPVTWTASASGGQTPYQYQWLVFNGSTWSVPTAWTTSNTFPWTPSPAGAYQIAVRARSAWNTGARDVAVSQPFTAQ